MTYRMRRQAQVNHLYALWKEKRGFVKTKEAKSKNYTNISNPLLWHWKFLWLHGKGICPWNKQSGLITFPCYFLSFYLKQAQFSLSLDAEQELMLTCSSRTGGNFYSIYKNKNKKNFPIVEKNHVNLFQTLPPDHINICSVIDIFCTLLWY